MPETCLFIRHAAAISSDDVPEPDWPLSPAGVQQARALAERFAQMPIAGVYSSPFLRAVSTVAPLAARLGLPVQPVADLRERHVRDTLIHPFEAFLAEMRRSFDDPMRALPSGESNHQVAARALRALDAIADQHPGAVFVAASHGNLTTALLQRFDPSVGFAFWRALGNPAVLRLTRADGQWSWDGAVT